MEISNEEKEVLARMLEVYCKGKVMKPFYAAPEHIAMTVLGGIVETYAVIHGTTAPEIFTRMLKVSLEVQEEIRKEDRE